MKFKKEDMTHYSLYTTLFANYFRYKNLHWNAQPYGSRISCT